MEEDTYVEHFLIACGLDAKAARRFMKEEYTYVKYISPDGFSLHTPEGAAMKDTITMRGLDVVRSVITPVTDEDRKAFESGRGA